MFNLHIVASREVLQGNAFRDMKGGRSRETHYVPDENTIREIEKMLNLLRENGGQMNTQRLYKSMPFPWHEVRRLIDAATTRYPLWEDDGYIGVLDER